MLLKSIDGVAQNSGQWLENVQEYNLNLVKIAHVEGGGGGGPLVFSLEAVPQTFLLPRPLFVYVCTWLEVVT